MRVTQTADKARIHIILEPDEAATFTASDTQECQKLRTLISYELTGLGYGEFEPKALVIPPTPTPSQKKRK